MGTAGFPSEIGRIPSEADLSRRAVEGSAVHSACDQFRMETPVGFIERYYGMMDDFSAGNWRWCQ
jgi:hypothetical protein